MDVSAVEDLLAKNKPYWIETGWPGFRCPASRFFQFLAAEKFTLCFL
jgi:hypothetical protein